MRILIAEDDRDSRRLLNVNLTWGGHEVVEAEDGEQAWRIWEKEHTRLIITDWMMPNLPGPDLIRNVRGANFRHYTYIIMLTALGAKPQVVTGLEAGADDYLTKPFYPEELLARVGIAERILKQQDMLEEQKRLMEYQAMHDSLTGLYNRRAIQEHAEMEFSRAAREGKPIGVVLLDVDHFKAINDKHGHHIGDQALRLVASVLSQNIRPYDHVGRWGGEEFLVVLPNTDLAESHTVAERIRMSIADALLSLPDGQTLMLNASLGVSSAVIDHGGSVMLDKLVHQADEALYRAKGSGRNRVCLYGVE